MKTETMPKLSIYADMLNSGKIFYAGARKDDNPVKPNDCNIRGLALELAVRDYFDLPLVIGTQRQNDIVFRDEDDRRHFMEVKSNSSPLDGILNRSSMISYAFFVDLDRPLNEQMGYVLKLKKFMDIGLSLGHIKSGTTKGGEVAVEYKTQTVYNYSKMEFHGKKAFKLAEAYAQAGAQSFEEFFI